MKDGFDVQRMTQLAEGCIEFVIAKHLGESRGQLEQRGGHRAQAHQNPQTRDREQNGLMEFANKVQDGFIQPLPWNSANHVKVRSGPVGGSESPDSESSPETLRQG